MVDPTDTTGTGQDVSSGFTDVLAGIEVGIDAGIGAAAGVEAGTASGVGSIAATDGLAATEGLADADADAVLSGVGRLTDEQLLRVAGRVESRGRVLDASRVALAAEIAHRSRRELGAGSLACKKGVPQRGGVDREGHPGVVSGGGGPGAFGG